MLYIVYSVYVFPGGREVGMILKLRSPHLYQKLHFMY